MTTFAEEIFELQCDISRIQGANHEIQRTREVLAECQRLQAYTPAPVIDEIERVTK